MTNLEQGHATEDFWVRWGWVWSAIYLVALFGALLLALGAEEWAESEAMVAVGIVVVAALWHGGWTFVYPRTLPEGNLRQRPLLMALHLIGLVVAWYALIQLSQAFFFVLYGMFGLFFYFLPLPFAIVGSTLLTLLVIYSDAVLAGEPIRWNGPFALGLTVSMVVAALFALWIHGIIRQSSERGELLRMLQETRQELAASERRAGQLEERQRLAGDIHDTLTQGFISIIMNLENAAPLLEDGEGKRYVNLAIRTARTSVAQARDVVNDLRPGPLVQASSLPDAIQRVAARWAQESDTAVDVAITGTPIALSTHMDIALLRAAQEALSNVRKHADAKNVKITLSYMADAVVLDVQDDGLGIDLKEGDVTAVRGGYGLTAMQERLARIKGEMTIESEPGEGTTLAVLIPLTGEVQ